MREERDCENKCECVLTDELLRRLQQIFDVEDEGTAIGFIEKDNITGTRLQIFVYIARYVILQGKCACTCT